jgi:hypothetical protein
MCQSNKCSTSRISYSASSWTPLAANGYIQIFTRRAVLACCMASACFSTCKVETANDVLVANVTLDHESKAHRNVRIFCAHCFHNILKFSRQAIQLVAHAAGRVDHQHQIERVGMRDNRIGFRNPHHSIRRPLDLYSSGVYCEGFCAIFFASVFFVADI